jgi:hypothetical protein
MSDEYHTEQKEIEVQRMKTLIIWLAVSITVVHHRQESASAHPAQRDGSSREFFDDLLQTFN